MTLELFHTTGIPFGWAPLSLLLFGHFSCLGEMIICSSFMWGLPFMVISTHITQVAMIMPGLGSSKVDFEIRKVTCQALAFISIFNTVFWIPRPSTENFFFSNPITS